MVLNLRNLLVGLVNLVLGIIAFFIGLRVIFQLFGANKATPFVAWIYSMSESLIYPFRGMFPSLNISGGMFLDTVAIISLVVYALLAYVVIALLDMAFKPVVDNEYHEHKHHETPRTHDIDHS